MSVILTPDEVKKYEAERNAEIANEPSWNVEIIKMIATLILDIVVIVLLVYASLNTSGELSSRFLTMLEIVIGAIFGVTATQISKN